SRVGGSEAWGRRAMLLRCGFHAGFLGCGLFCRSFLGRFLRRLLGGSLLGGGFGGFGFFLRRRFFLVFCLGLGFGLRLCFLLALHLGGGRSRGAGVDQLDGLLQRDRRRVGAARDVGVDHPVLEVRTVAAVEEVDRLAVRVLADLAQRRDSLA